MAPAASTDPAGRLRAAALETAARDLGRELDEGTTVVPAADREGSTNAVAYPIGDRTIIWCASDIAPRLASLDGPRPLTADEFVAASETLGGTFVGRARCRVLASEPTSPSHDGYALVELDRNSEADRQLLVALLAACPDDDVDEAEIDMDDLDAAIVVALAPDGSIASYASGRDLWLDADFDDIGVITHPDHRGKRLGSVTVAEFAKRRLAAGRMMFYNCDVDNIGSNRVAETVGFELVVTVAAAKFG